MEPASAEHSRGQIFLQAAALAIESAPALAPAAAASATSQSSEPSLVPQPSRHAEYGGHWGEGVARCFSLESDMMDEDHAVRLMPVPDNFLCPISASIMVDPVATVDGCVYERQYIERWFRERRQQGHRITSPITGLELPSATLMPLVALQRAIEVYLAHRPELKREHMAGRSFEEAAQILQSDLFAKQQVHATTQDKVKKMKQETKMLVRTLQAAEMRIAQLECALSAGAALGGTASASTLPEAAPAASCSNAGSVPGPPALDAKAAAVQCPGCVESSAGGKANRGLVAISVLLVLLNVLTAAVLWPRTRSLGTGKLAQEVDPFLSGRAGLGVDAPWGAAVAPAAEGATAITDNPAFEAQLEQIRNGSLDEKQRAAFMLRVFASEHAENQVAIAQAGAIGPLIGLLQEPTAALREESARALWNLARNNKDINLHNQQAIGQAGAVEPLVQLLSDEVPRVRVVAAAVLNDLAVDNLANQVRVAKAGATAPLVRLLQDESPASVMAASLLKSLAASKNRADPQVAMALQGSVRPLVSLLRADTLLAQEQAASTLGVLAAYSSELQAAIAQAGAIPPLVDRLQGDMMQGTAALALRNIAADSAENQAAIVQARAVEPLIKLLEDGMPGVREEAALALWNVAVNSLETQVEIIQAGAAIPLVALLKGDAQEQATLTLLSLTSGA